MACAFPSSIRSGAYLSRPQCGIFLSVRAVFPAAGRKIWYDDQRRVHQQIAQGSELIDYAFMGDDPNAADNRWLREAMEAQVPIIYFLWRSATTVLARLAYLCCEMVRV